MTAPLPSRLARTWVLGGSFGGEMERIADANVDSASAGGYRIGIHVYHPRWQLRSPALLRWYRPHRCSTDAVQRELEAQLASHAGQVPRATKFRRRQGGGVAPAPGADAESQAPRLLFHHDW
jgi:hypothetical protein